MFSLQPTLHNDALLIRPLDRSDEEALYKVASDPLIWEQHPEHDRWQRKVFEVFFQQALLSGGAFLILDRKNNEIAGTSRFYAFDEDENSIFIGYTFLARKFWGTPMNTMVKKLMLDYILQYVDLVKFHAGKNNYRSRKALEKLGAVLKGEALPRYFAVTPEKNVEYWLTKENWSKREKPE